MPIDQHIGGVLQMLSKSGGKPAHEVSLQESRGGYLALTFGTRTPEQVIPVASVEDTEIPGGSGNIKARIYRPEGDGSFPTVVFFHGGGFVIGNLDSHDNMCREICRTAESVVVSVDYRVAPENPFPAAIDDGLAATQWVLAHKDELGGSDLVAVAGDSAGGNMAAVIAQQLTKQGESLAAQLLIYPAIDHDKASYASREENAKGYFLELETLNWFFKQYAGDNENITDPKLTPIHADDFSGLPPAVVVTAEFDPLRDEGEAYGKKLSNAGVPTEIIRCDGMIHCFFDMGRWAPAAQQYIDSSIQRFAKMMRED